MRKMRIITILSLLGIAVICTAGGIDGIAEKEFGEGAIQPKKQATAALIVCKGLIDDGLYKSIKRRTEIAIDSGINYLIYQIETYGGLLESGDNISKYFILDAGEKAHTVAYVTTEAISAGAMIAVSCNDIIMKKNTTIGDCAPIQLGGKLEGVEREKTESFVRATFERAAEANRYPKALLRAMVSVGTEVYRVKNLETGEYEFFEAEFLPKDTNEFDLENKELIVKKEQLLTLTASKAEEYGIARAVVDDVNGLLQFFEKRDGVEFTDAPVELRTNWSEEMVRWLNSPTVMGILVMLALLGLYVEFNTPGLGLPGLVALICFVVIIGSKFLIGMANWVEVALFVAGVLILLIDLIFFPSMGFLAVVGLVCMIFGLFGMLIKNPPGRLPWPETDFDWQWFLSQVWAIVIGFAGFVVIAGFLRKYLPRSNFFNRLMLTPATAKTGTEFEVSMTAPAQQQQPGVKVGDLGEALSLLRPAGKARFGDAVVDVVAEGEYISKGEKIKITEIHGNRVVVRPE
jgi:membrane-bound serine protease (ClpP class)